MADQGFEQLLTDGRINAILAWGTCSLFVVTTIEGFLTGDYLWSTFAAVAGIMVALPAIASRNPRMMPPWELVLLAGLPVVGRAFVELPTSSDVATYLAIAALALLVAVNLHLFTSVEMSFGFAVLFVVVTTLAAAGVWAVARWASDLYLGTTLLLEPGLTRDEIEYNLMWEFVASSVAGLVAGLLFEVWVRRRAQMDSRISTEGML